MRSEIAWRDVLRGLSPDSSDQQLSIQASVEIKSLLKAVCDDLSMLVIELAGR